VCYYRHKVNFQPYDHIGEQDITAHINFSALRYFGSRHDLLPVGYTSQGRFLSALGIGNLPGRQMATNAASIARTLLIDPGSKIKVFIQQKNLECSNLKGLMFPEPMP
jgi:SAM-dependent MidA family methyltransferase